MDKIFNFNVRSLGPTILEITDVGLYLRFQQDVEVAETVIRHDWPHVAIDLDGEGQVVAIEMVPKPDKFSITELFEKSGVNLPYGWSPGSVEIRPQLSAALAQSA
jgi:hypothetical protein